jgi:hypothetical protein
MKIELPFSGGRIDVACFSGPYHLGNDKECVVLVETKDFKSGLDYAADQAKRYAQDFPACRVLVVTNGWCYKTFERSDNETFDDVKPSAYLNIITPRDKCPYDPRVDGALGVLKLLLPRSLR